jgi:MarR family 2-MHQ and catechol resistance regulon transcriptional repressor
VKGSLKCLDIEYLDVETSAMMIAGGGNGMDNSGTHVWLVLWKAYDALHAHAMQSIESLDMCITDFAILELLLHKGPTSINALGEKMSLASGSSTAAIDRLERRGLVNRTPSATDRRIKIVELTKEGKQLIQKAFDTHSDHMEFAVDGLTKAERTQLLVLMRKLGKSAEQRLTSD